LLAAGANFAESCNLRYTEFQALATPHGSNSGICEWIWLCMLPSCCPEIEKRWMVLNFLFYFSAAANDGVHPTPALGTLK
jgi:hypothetical protein